MTELEKFLMGKTTYRRILIARSSQKRTAAQWADVLGVSLSTAKRDVAAVRDARNVLR